MTIASVILNQTESNTHVRGHLVVQFRLTKYRVSQIKYTHLMRHKKVTVASVILKRNKKQHLSGRSLIKYRVSQNQECTFNEPQESDHCISHS